MQVLSVESYVDEIERGLTGLLSVFDDPSSVHFSGFMLSMERLERAVAAKTYLDAAFAYICERDDAGREVGSPYATEYLKERLGLSASEAYDRLGRGRQLFAPPAPPDPPAGDEQGGEEETLDCGGGGGAGASDAQQEEKERQEKARKNSRDLSAEKARIIQRCLGALTVEAACERTSILEKATEAAKLRSPEDLRKYVERLVANANRKHKPASDPNAAWDQRTLFFQQDEASGKYRITIDTTAGIFALLKSHVDAGLPANSNAAAGSGERDYRTPGQRRHDELVHILQNWERHRQSDRGGAASVIISVTADDLAGADPTSSFQTNVGVNLTPAEMMRLGLNGKDFVLQLDTVTGLPLSLGRTRLANVYQRIALLALQGVCAWEGCTRPMSELEVHHLHAYSHGGDTDLANLIGLCRTHHRANNDNRDCRDGRRHVDRDPAGSGEVGVVHADGTMHFNQTQGHTDSAGYKLRHRSTGPAPGSATGQAVGAPHAAAPPDTVLFPPPPS